MKDRFFLLWVYILDSIGIEDPWAQYAISRILLTILIFSIPAFILGAWFF